MASGAPRRLCRAARHNSGKIAVGGSEQLPFGNAHDAVNHGDNRFEGPTSGEVWKTFDGTQAYLEADLNIHLLVKFGGGPAQGQNYLTILQNKRAFRRYSKRFRGPRLRCDGGKRWGGPYGNDKSVFISVAEPMKPYKRAIPSVVWLEPLKELDSARACLPKMLEWCFFEMSPIRKDWELDPFQASSVHVDEVSGHKLNCRPGIVENISDDRAQPDWDRFLYVNDAMMSSVRIDLGPEGIGLATEKIEDCSLELREVFLCPFHFGAGSEPWFRFNGAHLLRPSRSTPLYSGNSNQRISKRAERPTPERQAATRGKSGRSD
jgi:hypothetical protein